MTDTSSETRRLATILAIDIAGFSRASERDEIAAAAHVRALRRQCGTAAESHRGRIFNTAGDGVMMEFPTVADGIAAALDIADAVRGESAMPPVRMGLHLGDVTVLANGDLIGAGVNVAARVQQRAQPGEILTTGDVRNLFATQAAAQFTAYGSAQLDKMNRQVDLYALGRPGEKVHRTLLGRVRAMRPLARSAALAVLGLAAGAGLYTLIRTTEVATPPAAPAAETQSTVPVIAVLPLKNLSGDPALDYFSDGITEEIQTTLAKIPGLRVIARASSFSIEGQHADIPEAARLLGASHVLTGTVRRNGDGMRVSAQLLAGRSGEILWSETFERPVSETLAVQDEIAMRVARALRIVVPESARAQAIDPRAFELYLRGRDSWRTGGEDGRPPQAAIADLEEAVRIAPEFARAWAALASAYAQRQNWLTGPEQDRLIAKAISAASRALELDPTIGEAYVVLGRFEPSPDWAARGMLFEQAVAASPNDDEVQMLTALFWLMETGRTNEALRVLERAYKGDKLSDLLTNNYVVALAAVGDTAGIEAVVAERRATWPDVNSAWTLVFSLKLRERDFEGARAALKEADAFLGEAAKRFPGKDIARLRQTLADMLQAIETDDGALKRLVADLFREDLGKGQAAALQTIGALSLLGFHDEAMAIAEELYVRRGFQSEAGSDFAVPARYPYGRASVAPLLSKDAAELQRDPRIWRVFAAAGLAKYWQQSGQWPDFCADPLLGYDCAVEAESALAAQKVN